MKFLLFLLILSFNCLAQEEIVNECGQTKDKWISDNARCLEVRGSDVVESYFNLETEDPELVFNVMTVEELEEQWELVK